MKFHFRLYTFEIIVISILRRIGMQLQIVGHQEPTTAEFVERKNKVKEELAHAYYSRKTVVIGIKFCIMNDADKTVGWMDRSMDNYFKDKLLD